MPEKEQQGGEIALARIIGTVIMAITAFAIILWLERLALDYRVKTVATRDVSIPAPVYPIQSGPITIVKGRWSEVKTVDIGSENIDNRIAEDNVPTDWLVNGKLYHAPARNSPGYMPANNMVIQSIAAKVADDSPTETATWFWTISKYR